MRKRSLLYFSLILIVLKPMSSFCLNGKLHPEKRIRIDESKYQIHSVSHVFFDRDCNIYILEGNNKVIKLTSRGRFIARIISTGNGPNELSSATEINFNRDMSQLLIHDNDKRKILYTDLSGRYIKVADPPVRGRPESMIVTSSGDYYFITTPIQNRCLVNYVDENLKPRNCFFVFHGEWGPKFLPFFNMLIDTDMKGNIYLMDSLEYLVHIYNKTGEEKYTFADPGPSFKQLPASFRSTNISSWMKYYSLITKLIALENKYIAVFYINRISKTDKLVAFDIYSLNSKRLFSDSLKPDFWPVGKDNFGRLVCWKTDISEDGTKVTNWLYIYSVKEGKSK